MDKFRAGFNAGVGLSCDSYKSDVVGSYEAAKMILDNIAIYTLYLHKQGLMQDFSNYGWVEQEVSGEWIEFDEDDFNPKD